MCVICRDTCANVVLRVPRVTAPHPPAPRLLFLHSDRRGPSVRGYLSFCWGGVHFKQWHPWWEGDQGWHLPSVLCSFLHHVQSHVAPAAGWGEGPSSSRMLLGGETSQVKFGSSAGAERWPTGRLCPPPFLSEVGDSCRSGGVKSNHCCLPPSA